MNERYSCAHLESAVDIPLNELAKLKEKTPCSDCTCYGPNLWVCLHWDCLRIGCSDIFNDHSTKHFMNQLTHCVHMNLSTLRIWCYICESEVFMDNTRRTIVYQQDSESEDYGSSNFMVPTRKDPKCHTLDRHSYDSGRGSYSTLKMDTFDMRNYGFDKTIGLNVQMSCDSDNSSDADETSELNNKPRGLVGLQNIGNTCYMNSALQALSNTTPLTNYFLDCGAALTLASENKKPGLSRSYQRLMKEMWNKRTRGYVVPSGILYGIRNVHPMFRGYHQHDTQEFLRCFMDQLHEELKEPLLRTEIQVIGESQISSSTNSKQQSAEGYEPGYSEMWRDSPSPSQSEGEYETCDSGVSERSSLSDDTERQQHFQTIMETTVNIDQSSELNENGDVIDIKRETVSTKRKLSPDSRSPVPRCKLTAVQYKSSVIESQPSTSGTTKSGSNKKTLKYRSIISDIFDGKLLSSVQCLTCDRISTRIETFQDLSLPIPGRDHITMLHQTTGSKTSSLMVGGPEAGVASLATCTETTRDGWWLGWLWGWLRSWFYGPAVSLHDCLAAFFSADELKGDNMYSCEKCNKLRNGMKFSKVIELPEVLCIHLKRFRHELMFSSKISSQVSFPLTGLDMRPYLHKDCVSTVSQYSLSSVICHHGTAGGGHYTCYALNNGTWFEFDDQYVTSVSPETVQACEAYVLFYRKIPQQILQIRQRAYELAEHNPPYPYGSTCSLQSSNSDTIMNSAGDIRFYVSRQWINRFNNCAEPGPIDNTDFLCVHGGVNPAKIPYIEKLSVVLSQPVWEYLYETFGGGPACSHLYDCPICERQAAALSRKIRTELDTYVQLQREFQNIECPSTVYAISMNWLRTWQSFVRGLTDDPPEPIDNTNIIVPGTKDNPQLKIGSDYTQISKELWLFFQQIYGGGPEVMLRSSANQNKTQNQILQNRDNATSPVPVTTSQSVITTVPEEPCLSNSSSVPKVPSRFSDMDHNNCINENIPNLNIENTASSVTVQSTKNQIVQNDIPIPGHVQNVTSIATSSSASPVVVQKNSVTNNSSTSKTITVSDNLKSASTQSVEPDSTSTLDISDSPVTYASSEKIPEFVIPGLRRPPKVYTITRSGSKRHDWKNSSETDSLTQRYNSLKSTVSRSDATSKITYMNNEDIVNDKVNEKEKKMNHSVSEIDHFHVNSIENDCSHTNGPIEDEGPYTPSKRIDNPDHLPSVHLVGKLKRNHDVNKSEVVGESKNSHKNKGLHKKGANYKNRKSSKRSENNTFPNGENLKSPRECGDVGSSLK